MTQRPDNRRPADGKTHRFAFVIEQTLGHVTHFKNLRASIDAEPSVSAAWYPITYPFRDSQYTPLSPPNPITAAWSASARKRVRQVLGRAVASYDYDAWTTWASWRAWYLLTRAHAAHRYDALYFHTQPTTLLCMRLMRRVPSVISLDVTPRQYNTIGVAYGHRPSGTLVEGVKHALYTRAFRNAGALITWSQWTRQSLIDDYGIDGARITVIPPGMNLDQWPHPTRREASERIRILFVGGDFARKGGEILLRAFAAQQCKHCELHIVTKSPVRPAPGVVVYHDVAPNSDLLKRLFATADIFALPTLADASPLVSIEAMACGLPVISCPIGGIPEIVRDGETGLLVPPGDVQALTVALETLSDNVAMRQVMGMRGRVLAEQNHDSAKNARHILSLMTGLSCISAQEDL